MTNDFFAGKHYWIIGASEGIGAALAVELAARGARLTVSARRLDALETVAAACSGPVTPRPMDLGSPDDVASTLAQITSYGPLDGVICVAALYDPGTLADLDIEATRTMLEVNLLGYFQLARIVPPRLVDGGQLVLFGSVAGYIGLPKGQPYSATKAAVANLAETLYLEQSDRIDVRLVSPGFVRTRLTDRNDFEMPDLMEPEDAAIAIADGLSRTGFEIHFPKRFTHKLKVLRTLPYRWAFAVLRRIT